LGAGQIRQELEAKVEEKAEATATEMAD